MEDLEVKETLVESKVDDEPTYSIKDFMENCEALGYKKEVVAGALFNCNKDEITKIEFEDKIKNFLRKKVE